MKKIIVTFLLGIILITSMGKTTIKADTLITRDIVCDDGSNFDNWNMVYHASHNEKTCLYLGQKVQLNITNLLPGMVWDWKCKTPEVGSITTDGLISVKTTGTFKAKGVCELDGNTYTISFAAYVKKPYLPAKKVKLVKGQQFKAKLVGAEAKKYQSSNKKVASVSKKGMVTAKKAGKCKIKVKDTNGKSYTLNVSIRNSKSSKHYDSCLKTKSGKVIIRFNKLNKKVMKSKVTEKKNSYLNKTSEAYYYIRTKDGEDVVLQATKNPLAEECYFYGQKDVISTSTAVGPLGKFQGIVGSIFCQFSLNSQYPSYVTNQGTFYYDDITYYYGENSGDKKGDSYAENEIFTMKKNGYYITLYTYNLKKHRRRYDLDKIADALFQ